MSTWTKKEFSYPPLGSLNLHYMGKKERFFNHSYGPHTINSCLLVFVLEGAAKFRIRGKEVDVRENDFYVMFPWEDMSYVTEPDMPWTIQWIVAEGEQLETLLQMVNITPEHPVLPIRRPDRLKLIYDNLFEKTNRIDLPAKMECLSLLYDLFSLLASESTAASKNPHVCRALDYIHAHYHEDLNISQLAQMLHLNNNYFTKLFKQEMGVTPIRYIQTMRFEKAQHLLKYTHLTVTEIGRQVGIDDTLYFSRGFKAFAGCSPSEYRKKVR